MGNSQTAKTRREAAEALFDLMDDGRFTLDLDAIDRINPSVSPTSAAQLTVPCDTLP
jgi:hypothetical protein